MRRSHKTHIIYYIVLIVILLLFLILLQISMFDKRLEMLLVIGMGILYTFWGILHHGLEHTISAKIVIEYILIGGIAIVLIWSMLS